MDPHLINRDYEHLIGLLYQGTLEEQPWQSALPLLREVLDAQVVSLVLRPPSNDDRGAILNCVRPEANMLRDQGSLADPSDWEASAYRDQFFALDPFVNLPVDEVVALEDILPDAELHLIPEQSHAMIFRQPWRVGAIMAAFLEEHE